jgi:hypothetical protein
MTRVIVSEDCGNSPKNIFLKNLTIALAKRDSRFILDNVTDDFRWNIPGEQLIEGKHNFAKALEKLKADTATEMSIQHIATHGKAGFVNGITQFRNGKTYAYCDAYTFSNTKGTAVKEITSYLIEIE